MSRVIILLFLIPVIGLISCSKKPRYILSSEKMEDVLYDIQLAQTLSDDYEIGLYRTEDKEALINDVFYKHHITKEKFDSSLTWYSDNMEDYKKINDAVTQRLKNQIEILRTTTAKRYDRNDSLLMPITFTLKSETPLLSFALDSNMLRNIDLTLIDWHFKALGASSRNQAEAVIEYTYPDTIVENVVKIDHNQEYTLAKPDLNNNLKNIAGYIRLVSKNMDSNILLYNINYMDSTIKR